MNVSRYIAVSALALATATSAWAQQKAPQVRGSLDAVTVLPPPTPATQAALPPGHPGAAGHAPAPDAGIPGHSGSMVAAQSGALRVNFSQGTENGPPIGRDPVTVQLMAKGNMIKSYKTAVNDKGLIEVHDLPLEVAFQPVITIEHAGAQEQLVGPAMHKFQPMVELDMKVYEVTTERPAWNVGIRSIATEIVDLGPLGLGMQFVDTLGCMNPSDRAWAGGPPQALAVPLAPSHNTESRVLTIPLSINARDVQFGPGMAEAGAKVVDNAAIRGKTMLPGPMQYVLGYTVPVQGGKLTATFTAPAETGLFALYVPGDVKIETAEGLEIGKASGTNGQQSRQLLKAKSVKAGQTLSVTMSNLKLVPKSESLPQTTDLNLPHPAKPETKP